MEGTEDRIRDTLAAAAPGSQIDLIINDEGRVPLDRLEPWLSEARSVHVVNDFGVARMAQERGLPVTRSRRFRSVVEETLRRASEVPSPIVLMGRPKHPRLWLAKLLQISARFGEEGLPVAAVTVLGNERTPRGSVQCVA